MLVSEMHLQFKLDYDKIDNLTYPNLEPEEIDLILNKALNRFIKQRDGGNNYRRESFEQSQKRIEDLRGLVTTSSAIAAVATSDPKVYTIQLPTDYYKLESMYINCTGSLCGGVAESFVLETNQVTHDELREILRDPFWKPNKQDKLPIVIEGNKIRIFNDGSTTINSAILTYIKIPLKLSISATGVNNPTGFTNECEIAPYIHQEIVDLAVNMALETIESQRYQSNSIDINKQE